MDRIASNYFSLESELSELRKYNVRDIVQKKREIFLSDEDVLSGIQLMEKISY